MWLTQKAKLEAIQKLSQKKTQQAHTLQMKAEQKQLDEFSTNLYLRSR
jgi:flagellar FliJ protein